MTGIGSIQLEFPHQAQQDILSHQPQDVLAVNHIAPVFEFCCNSPLAMARKFEDNRLNLALDVDIYRGIHFRPCAPSIVAAATYFKCLAEFGYRQTTGDRRGVHG